MGHRIDCWNFPCLVLDKSPERPCSLEDWALLRAAGMCSCVSHRMKMLGKIMHPQHGDCTGDRSCCQVWWPQKHPRLRWCSGWFRISRRAKYKTQQESVLQGHHFASTHLRALVHHARGLIWEEESSLQSTNWWHSRWGRASTCRPRAQEGNGTRTLTRL